MYRCYSCDSPAQAKCECIDETPANIYDNGTNDKRLTADPWNWIDDEKKKDISSGEDVVC